MSDARADRPALAVGESVRCLECGLVYSKPAGGGTVIKNPGCPDCGYVGWLSASIPFTDTRAQRRSAADLPQHRRAQSG
jgi:predicted  nucleic acid-binding Zn-ribbon protein